MTRLAAFAACAIASASAHAQPLADPTRPPNVAAFEPAAGEAPAAGLRLESVLIAPNRRVAVINGKAVALHGAYEGRRVVRISESEVELRDDSGSEILKLFPNVDKQARASRARRAVR